MSNEADTLRTRWDIDSPWGRLPWTLPTALLICGVVLLVLAHFMERPVRQTVPAPIEAQFIEQAVPKQNMKQNIISRPAAPHKPKALPPARPRPIPKAPPPPVSQHTEQNPAAQKPEVAPTTGVSAPAAAVPNSANATPYERQAAAANPPSVSGAQGPSDVKGRPGGNIYANSGAKAIIQPKPQIPDDMRDEAFNFTVKARFHIAPDGSATVELARPTPNPRLNRVVLDTLKKWRFMPAIKNGRPVTSTLEIDVRIEVN